MKKEAFEAELQAVLKEAEDIQEQTKLEQATDTFLGKQIDTLKQKHIAETLPVKRNIIEKQMLALQQRILREIKMREEGEVRMKALEDKMHELELIYSAGLVEEE